VNRGIPPPFYSNLVTMRGGASAEPQRRLIREMLASCPDRPFGFKDSFSCIGAAVAGGDRRFHVLFEATWIWLDAALIVPGRTDLSWVRAGTDADLLEWESAWRHDDANLAAANAPRQFPGSLLADPELAFLAGKTPEGQIKAVAAANLSGDSVGLSNVFGPRVAAPDLWRGATIAAKHAFPQGRQLVGYERSDNLTHATALGFEPIGTLRVYVSKESV
jgi:hypothetical protein